jgi:hypothetical protein
VEAATDSESYFDSKSYFPTPFFLLLGKMLLARKAQEKNLTSKTKVL